MPGSTTVESYGVVGMAAQKTGDSIFELLGRENLRKGVVVKFVENACVVDLHIIVEYGVSIGAVCAERHRQRDLPPAGCARPCGLGC